MHPLNKPSTVRDVIEARNYVVRAAIRLSRFVIALVVAGIVAWGAHRFSDSLWQTGVFVLVFGGFVMWLERSSVSPLERDLEKSERACRDTPTAQDAAIAKAQREVDELQARLDRASELVDDHTLDAAPEVAAAIRQVAQRNCADLREQLERATERLNAAQSS